MSVAARICVLLLSSLVFTTCTSSLENIAEERHQENINAAIASQPVTRGGSDGAGAYIADTTPHYTLETPAPDKSQNP